MQGTGNLVFGIREIFARSIRNPRILNLEYSSTGIQNQAITIGIWDPETTSWNPVSKTSWISLLEEKSIDL